MLSIAICNNQPAQRKQLKQTLEVMFQLRGESFNLKETINGESLIDSLMTATFDLIFLDVDLYGIQGIRIAKLIREKAPQSLLIFVTDRTDFIFQGQDVRAFNYLLKPINHDKLVTVINQALKEISSQKHNYLTIQRRRGTIRLPLMTTTYFYSDKRQVIAVTRTGDVSFYDKLDNIEKELPDFFIRIHKSYLVNLNDILFVNASTVQCGDELLPISRSYQKRVATVFEAW